MNLDLFSNFESVNARVSFIHLRNSFKNIEIFSGLILVSRIDDVNSFRNGVKMLKIYLIEIKKVFWNIDSWTMDMEVVIR